VKKSLAVLLFCTSIAVGQSVQPGILLELQDGEHVIGLGSPPVVIHPLIRIGPDPDPDPPPPDNLAGFAATLAGRVDGVTAAEAAAIGANYREVARLLELLRDPLQFPPVRTPNEAIAVHRGLTADTLGARSPAWQPFLDGLTGRLEQMTADGEIPNTVYDVADVFGQIADGLAQIRPRGPPVATPSYDGLERYLPADGGTERQTAADGGMSEEDLEKLYNYHVPPAGVDPEDDANQSRVNLGSHEYDPAVYLDQPGEPEWVRAIAREEAARFDHLSRGVPRPVAGNFPRGGRGKRAVYWNYALRWDDDPTPCYSIRQNMGNCTAASGGDVTYTLLYGVAVYKLGRSYQWRGCGSSSFYMFRGHRSAGMALSTLATAHNRYGTPWRISYPGGPDLTDTITDQNYGRDNSSSQPAGFLAQTSKCPTGRIERFSGGVDEAIAVLFAGGALHTGSTATWSSGNPIGRAANVGPHAQTCIGYDDTDEMKQRFGIDEPLFFFDQTWGGSVTSYVKSGWVEEWWGRRTDGIGIIPWSAARRLIQATCYAYYPDGLTGFPQEPINWRATPMVDPVLNLQETAIPSIATTKAPGGVDSDTQRHDGRTGANSALARPWRSTVPEMHWVQGAGAIPARGPLRTKLDPRK
jgi:hypothetical protein